MLCHCDTALPLTCYFASVVCCLASVMYAASPCNSAFPPSCYFATVMLLCISLAALPLSCFLPVSCHFASVTLLCLCNAALPLLCCFVLPLSSCYMQCHNGDIYILIHIKCGHPHAVYGYAMCWWRCYVGSLLLPCTVCCWLRCVALLRYWVAVCLVCLEFFIILGGVSTLQTFSHIHI